MTCIVFPQWRLPPGYDRQSSDLLLRLPAGYPDVPPDMWWFDPAVRLSNGQVIQATEATEQHLGRSWQRWSRHFANGQWRSGVDGLESFVALIQRELTRSAGSARR
jgi:E2/UBC family protein E